jgi:lipid-binding SYLF domain-containing protein
LGLHFSDFSMIFYAIYKKQAIHFTIGVTTCRMTLGKEFSFAMWPLGRAAGAAPAKIPAGPVGEGRGAA